MLKLISAAFLIFTGWFCVWLLGLMFSNHTPQFFLLALCSIPGFAMFYVAGDIFAKEWLDSKARQ